MTYSWMRRATMSTGGGRILSFALSGTLRCSTHDLERACSDSKRGPGRTEYPSRGMGRPFGASARIAWIYSGWSKDVIRIFSSSDGRLMRTIEAGGWGLRGNFVISPSGRLVVADASKIVPYFLKEPNMGQKIGRFVLLDAQDWGGALQVSQEDGGLLHLAFSFCLYQ